VVIGLIIASFSAMQFIFSPIWGRLSDRHGRRPILLLSTLGAALSYALFAWGASLANHNAALWVMVLSRMLAGLCGGNITVAQAYIADVTDEQNRAKGLGLIGAAFGLGFIIGPATGGTLSQWGYNLPAFVAASVSAMNLILIFFWLPESLTSERREAASLRLRPPFTLNALLQALNRPKVGPLLYVRFFYGLAFATFQSIFSLYAQAIGLSSQTTGYVLAYVGLLSVVVQGGLIGVLTRRFRENWLIITGLWLMTGALLAWAFTANLWLLLVVLLPLALSGGVLNTVIQSAISKSVSREDVGGMLGFSASLEAATRVIAPSVGGYLLQNLGTWAPGVFSAVLMAWAVTFAYRRIILPTRWERLTAATEASDA
jgi:DHA1 family tetracycline resistance protein-like MFS transporter